MPDEFTTLYRPAGRKELGLIRDSGFRAFPPRFPHGFQRQTYKS